MAATPESSLKANRELAEATLSVAGRYAEAMTAALAGHHNDETKTSCLSNATMAALTLNSVVDALPAMRRELPVDFHPPLTVLLLLGSVASSSLLLAVSSRVDDISLLSGERMKAMLSSRDVVAWLGSTLRDSAE